MSIPIELYLPIAGNSVNIAAVFGLGGAVGLLSGIFGVGGGFLMTPLLIMMGIPPTVAAASDSNQIVGASTSGTLAHLRLGNVDVKMGVLLLVGGVLGGTVGVEIIKILRQMGNADFLINITYVLMLGLVGGYMFVESLQSMKKAKAEAKAPSTQEKHVKSSAFGRFSASLPWQMEFKRSGVRMSPLLPLFLGGLVGVLSAIMGVGGGFIMVPVMVYLLRMPMHVVVGTSLFQILFTCINVTVMQSIFNHTVDFVLALILLIGSALGAQIGAKIGKKLHGDQLKILLATLVLVVMFKILYELLATPNVLLAYVGGH
ncbi:MAG: sulfite exporter TauE/SafE family protein [Desulfovibrionaceae bacterium]|nr:sulfite exporter TauE/SafE family protein [Desulfovibrionaceae bacterium]MBF0513728.1 sulfite exporter TauE/SafE family protein [Desulfovibrionaceae bacterium]